MRRCQTRCPLFTKNRKGEWSAVTRNGEAEVDTKLIATISGHSLATVDTILERYMVRTSKMARAAFARRAEAEGKSQVVPLNQPKDGTKND